MLDELGIKRFQSHEDTRLIFDKGINVIVGRSSSGKTSIIRALQLLKDNRPSGFAYHSQFSKEPTEIDIIFDNHKIVFEKDKKGASYDIDGKKLSVIGQNVPDEVKLLNMNEINIQEQLSQHFLITDTPGEVAKYINKIIKVEKVDEWISALTTDINSFTKEIDIYKDQLKEKNEKLLDKKYMEQFKIDVCYAEHQQELLDYALDKSVDIKNIIDNYNEICDDIETIKARLGSKKILNVIEKNIDRLNDIDEKCFFIEKCIDTEKEVKDFVGVTNENTKTIIDNIESLLLKLENSNERFDIINTIVADYEKYKEQINNKSISINENKKELEEYIEKIGVCIFCGQVLTDESVKYIMGE